MYRRSGLVFCREQSTQYDLRRQLPELVLLGVWKGFPLAPCMPRSRSALLFRACSYHGQPVAYPLMGTL